MCRHDLREVRRRYTPPKEGLRVKGVSEQFAERASFGFTTVELYCLKCHDVVSRILLGDLRGEAR